MEAKAEKLGTNRRSFKYVSVLIEWLLAHCAKVVEAEAGTLCTKIAEGGVQL